MATHSSILAWTIPTDRGTWQAAAYGATKSWTRLKQLSTTQKYKLMMLKKVMSASNREIDIYWNTPKRVIT